MAYRELHYHWQYDLKANPEQLWPFVADTNRFNRDTGLPAVEVPTGKKQRLRNARRKLQLSLYGFPVEWEEQPFEWIRPQRFGVVRNYTKGPVGQLRALVELTPLDRGGTRLTYEVWITPKTILGALAIPFQVRFLNAPKFARAFRKYDDEASVSVRTPVVDTTLDLPSSVLNRMASIKERLIEEGADAGIITFLNQP